MSDPRVSVICIFLDGERYIAEAIDSVLAQQMSDFELLLVDDGSSDESSAIARDFARRFPDQVYAFDHPGHANLGMSASRNAGLRRARGEFVAFIDCDDRWRPAKLEEQLDLMRSHPELGMVCGTVNYWGSWDGGKDRVIPTGRLLDRVVPPPAPLVDLYPLGGADAPCPSDVMLRRSAIDHVGGFEEQFTGLYEDIVFFSKVFATWPVWFSSLTWLDYRQHPGSSSSALTRVRYRTVRRQYLDWLEGHLATLDLARNPGLATGLERLRWELDHPIMARGRRAVRKALRQARRQNDQAERAK